MRIVWTTDLHLNHAPVQAWEQWVQSVRDQSADAIVITGDISEGDDVTFQLRRVVEALGMPVHFVLGNHDFYESSIARTRRSVIDLCRELPLLHYLTDVAAVTLAGDTVLVGDDGWGDAKVGDYEKSPVQLNDFRLIDDFRQAPPDGWKTTLLRLGELSAARLSQKLSSLPASTARVLVATHVPPFREACWYEGHTTDDLWAPFFVCGALGDVLLDASAARPDCQFQVICGHTHHSGVAELRENLTIYTGAAEYGVPAVEGVIEATAEQLRML